MSAPGLDCFSKPQNPHESPEYARDWYKALEQKGWWHSFQLPDGTRIDGVNTVEGMKTRLARFPIPENLTGKRVLDIGTWDGWFAFEMERRGAQVVATDCWDNPNFNRIHRLLKSKVEFRRMDFFELTPAKVGQFDIVLFLGVLCHLKHPLLALERVCALTKDFAAIESFVSARRPDGDAPEMEFYETDELGGQTDNWVGPNVPCLLAFCRTAGFARVELLGVLDYGAAVACYRHWAPAEDPHGHAPVLSDAVHNRDEGINFRTDIDEYLTVWFKWEDGNPTIDDVQPEVGGFGTRPIIVKSAGGAAWFTNFKLPPGIAPGWSDVTLRIGDGPRSNALSIAVDMPRTLSRPPVIAGIRDGATWEDGHLDLRHGRILSVWVEGLPENADRNLVALLIGAWRIQPMFISPPENSVRQLNFLLPPDAQPSETHVRIEAGGQIPEPSRVHLCAG